MGIGAFRSGDHVPHTRTGHSERDVLGNSGAEQLWLLAHEANLLTQPRRIHGGDGNAIDGDGPLLHVIEALQQVHNGRFAATTWTNKRGNFAGRYAEAHPRQYRLVGPSWVGKVDVLCVCTPSREHHSTDAMAAAAAATRAYLKCNVAAHGVESLATSQRDEGPAI